jgi:hypothetical protein
VPGGEVVVDAELGGAAALGEVADQQLGDAVARQEQPAEPLNGVEDVGILLDVTVGGDDDPPALPGDELEVGERGLAALVVAGAPAVDAVQVDRDDLVAKGAGERVGLLRPLRQPQRDRRVGERVAVGRQEVEDVRRAARSLVLDRLAVVGVAGQLGPQDPGVGPGVAEPVDRQGERALVEDAPEQVAAEPAAGEVEHLLRRAGGDRAVAALLDDVI